MKFNIKKKSDKARSGTLTLKHGTVQTPAFMTVGTYGSVKSLTNQDLLELYPILVETYNSNRHDDLL